MTKRILTLELRFVTQLTLDFARLGFEANCLPAERGGFGRKEINRGARRVVRRNRGLPAQKFKIVFDVRILA